MKNKKKNNNDMKTLSADAINSQPETAFELINKYGTYEIQPTNDSDHDFPKIAQGLPKPENRILDND